MMRYRSLLGLLALCPVFCVPAATTQADSTELGEARRVQQVVTRDGVTLEQRDKIRDGMTVVTRKRAGAYILLENPKTGWVQMGGNTSLTFNQSVVKGKLDIKLALGRCLAYFWPEDVDSEGLIRIRTDAGIVTLLGTAVYLDVARDGRTFISVLEGKVEVQRLVGGEPVGDPVKVSPGPPMILVPGQPMTELVSVSPGARPDLRIPDVMWLLEPPLVDLNDPRLDLPK